MKTADEGAARQRVPLTDAELNMTPAEWSEAFTEDPSCFREYLLAAVARGRLDALEEAARLAMWRAAQIAAHLLPVSAVNELRDLASTLASGNPPQAAPSAEKIALRELFGFVESGDLVRCTARDDEPEWALRSMNLVMALKRAQELIGADARAAPSGSPGGARVWTRQQCSPGEFGREVRFEIEHEDGTIVRYLGTEAEMHCAALNAACACAGDRIVWPTALPEVSRGEPRRAPDSPDLSTLKVRD